MVGPSQLSNLRPIEARPIITFTEFFADKTLSRSPIAAERQDSRRDLKNLPDPKNRPP